MCEHRVLRAGCKLAVLALLLWSISVTAAGAETRYTPPDVWRHNQLSGLYESWFGSQLERMGEPSLWELSKRGTDAKTYRLLVIPTRWPAFAARLVVQSDGSGKIHISELDGAGGYDPGKLKNKRTVDVSADKVLALDGLFEKVGFWTDRIGPETKEWDGCRDGVIHVLEGVQRENYKLVTRSHCVVENDVRRLLYALADLAWVERPPIMTID